MPRIRNAARAEIISQLDENTENIMRYILEAISKEQQDEIIEHAGHTNDPNKTLQTRFIAEKKCV